MAGTGLGLMYVPAVVSVGYYFDKRRALATGVVCSGSGAGTFILAPFASFLLIQLGGWRGAMRVFAGEMTNQRPVLRSHDHSGPIRGQYQVHVITLDQS